VYENAVNAKDMKIESNVRLEQRATDLQELMDGKVKIVG
jgi:hypothetical protein